jgi:hypothetical protein
LKETDEKYVEFLMAKRWAEFCAIKGKLSEYKKRSMFSDQRYPLPQKALF